MRVVEPASELCARDVENGSEKQPYVTKEVLPKVEGVLVVAEGGDDPRVISDISDTVMALFRVEAHKIKVMKRNVAGTE